MKKWLLLIGLVSANGCINLWAGQPLFGQDDDDSDGDDGRLPDYKKMAELDNVARHTVAKTIDQKRDELKKAGVAVVDQDRVNVALVAEINRLKKQVNQQGQLIDQVMQYEAAKIEAAIPFLKNAEQLLNDNTVKGKDDTLESKEALLRTKSKKAQFPYIGNLPIPVLDLIECNKNIEQYRKFNVFPDQAFVLYGVTGTGKTVMATEIAKKLDAEIIHLNAATIKDKYVGGSEEKLRSLFDDAIAKAKKTGKRVVIFLDEIESLLLDRGNLSNEASPSYGSTVNQFLTLIENLPENIVFIGATNNFAKLDKASVRPGRLKPVYVPLPTEEQRTALFKGYINFYTPQQVVGDVQEVQNACLDYDIARWVKMTEGYTPAFIQKVMEEAAFKCAKNNQVVNSETIDSVLQSKNLKPKGFSIPTWLDKTWKNVSFGAYQRVGFPRSSSSSL